MKKITVFLVCLMMVIGCCFTGCAKFSVDPVKFYNETIALVDGEKITRYDLNNAYRSYGYTTFVTQQGLSEDEARTKTLDLMINTRLISAYAKEKALTDDDYKLTRKDINDIYKNVLDYMANSFKTYLTTAREIYGVDEPQKGSDDSDEKTYLQSDYKYKKRAVLTTGDIIQYIEDEDEDIIEEWALDQNSVDDYSNYTIDQLVVKLFNKAKANLAENKYLEKDYEKIYLKAYDLLGKTLINYEYYLRDENGKRYSTDTESLIKRLIKNNLESEIDNAYISNLEEVYLKNTVLDLNKLKKKYKEMAEADFAKYSTSVSTYYDYLKTIGSNAELTYYTPENATAKFGYFFHTLLPFDNTITKEDIQQIKDLGIYDNKEQEGEVSKLDAAIENKLMDIQLEERDLNTGKALEGKRYLSQVLEEYAYVQTEEQFFDFMFKYTSDTATLTAKMPYVIGYEGETNYSSMVTEFTNEAVRLMKNNEKMTSSTGYIVTEYGVHLLCYLGDVRADFDYANRASMNITLNNSAENNLYYKQLNKWTEKTYFDLLFDLVYPASSGSNYASQNGYSDYEQSIIDGLQNKVTIYETKLNAKM